MANPFDNAVDAPSKTPLEATPQTSGEAGHQTALRLLDEVHQELHDQTRADRFKGMAGHIVDLAYDPIIEDHVKLSRIGQRIDEADKNGDYDIIAAQQQIIDAELKKDRIDDSRKNTVDDIAHDFATVIPSIFKGALRAGEKAVESGFRTTAAALPDSLKPSPIDVGPTETITRGGDYREEINFDGKERAFNFHVPKGYKPGHSVPAVVMLHGITQDADTFAQETNMNAKADKENFIAVYPEGNPLLDSKSHLAWNVPNWNILHPSRHADDVQFVGQVIDKVTGELSIDPNRTYVAGFSNGGMLAQEVAAQNSDKVAAVAIVSAALSGKDKEPTSPVSVIDIHGTADTVVPYKNWDNSFRLVNMQPVAFTGTFWKKADGISGPAVTSTKNGITVQDSVNKETGVEVKQIGIEGGTHTWPGANNTGAPDQSLEATDEIWKFFSSHTLGHGDLTTLRSNQTMSV